MSGPERPTRGRHVILIRSVIVAISLILLVVTLVTTLGSSPPKEDRLPQDNRLSPLGLLGEIAGEGFAQAGSQWNFRFPNDHGSHGPFRTEWWYVFGVLNGPHNRGLGIQLVFTRVGLLPETEPRRSKWAALSAYYGFVTLSDPSSGNLHAGQRLSRAALRLAGATTEPTRIWIENWQLEALDSGKPAPDWQLHANVDAIAFDLELDNAKPLVTSSQIEALAPQGRLPFHFYTQPRLKVGGTLTLDGQRMPINGTLSIEHAWGELPLPGAPVARDRFVMYLNDGRELLCVRTHSVDGTGEPTTTGILVERDGDVQPLSDSEIKISPLGYWSSERSGARYPVSWTINLRERNLRLKLTPYMQNQEANLWAPVWAGAVHVSNRRASNGPTGYGFVQLAGYKGP